MTDDFVDDLPNSIYMTLRTTLSPMRIVKLFTSQGWSWRHCAWDEYEITFDNIAELVVASQDLILISGGVATDSNAIEQIEKILDGGGVDFDFELYDRNNTTIRSRPNPTQSRNA